MANYSTTMGILQPQVGKSGDILLKFEHKNGGDQGSQYTAFKFRKHLRKLGVKQSFSNPGTPLDNAVAESFFACMKREELSHNYYDCLEDLRHDVSNYIDFFNNMRPHQRLGMQTPAGVEAQFMAEKN